MKINRRFQNVLSILVLLIVTFGLLVGTFFDQEIAPKLAHTDSLFAILLTAFGVIATLSTGVYASVVLFFSPAQKRKGFNAFLKIISILAFLGCNVYEIDVCMDYADFEPLASNADTYKVLIIVLVILINMAIILFTQVSMRKLDEKAIVPTCLTILFIIGACTCGTEIIKYLASRPRPFAGTFRNWYEFKPFECLKLGDDYKSFVSGHATNSTEMVFVLPLALSLRKVELKKSSQVVAIIIGVLYGFVVAISRLMLNVHYLSDVAGGMLIALLGGLIVYNIINAITNKIYKEKR